METPGDFTRCSVLLSWAGGEGLTLLLGDVAASAAAPPLGTSQTASLCRPGCLSMTSVSGDPGPQGARGVGPRAPTQGGFRAPVPHSVRPTTVFTERHFSVLQTGCAPGLEVGSFSLLFIVSVTREPFLFFWEGLNKTFLRCQPPGRNCTFPLPLKACPGTGLSAQSKRPFGVKTLTQNIKENRPTRVRPFQPARGL